MKTRSIGYIILATVIAVFFTVGVFLLHQGSKESDVAEATEIADINADSDEKILSDDELRKSILSQRLQQKLLQHSDSVNDAVEEQQAWLKDFFWEANQATTAIYKYDIIRRVYEKNNDQELLPVLFRLSIETRDFEAAFAYLNALNEQQYASSEIDVNEYLYTMFNVWEVDFAHLERLKKIVVNYQEKWLISKADQIFYFSLITLIRWDIKNYEIFMNQLEATKYKSRSDLYRKAKAKFESYEDVPEYYLQGLLTIWLFRGEWYSFAKKVAYQMLEKDKEYILWYQLVAYSSIMTWSWAEALEALHYLSAKDVANKELYVYLTWVTAFNLERYEDAVLSFNQLREQKYNKDVLRYSMLSFIRLADVQGYVKVVSRLAAQKNLWVYDYISLFDSLFYINWWAGYREISEQKVKNIFTTCYENLKDEQRFACLYGKAWYYLTSWATQKAYSYLERVVIHYPSKSLYRLLWDLSLELENEKAVQRYVSSLMNSTILDDQNELKEKIRSLVK